MQATHPRAAAATTFTHQPGLHTPAHSTSPYPDPAFPPLPLLPHTGGSRHRPPAPTRPRRRVARVLHAEPLLCPHHGGGAAGGEAAGEGGTEGGAGGRWGAGGGLLLLAAVLPDASCSHASCLTLDASAPMHAGCLLQPPSSANTTTYNHLQPPACADSTASPPPRPPQASRPPRTT